MSDTESENVVPLRERVTLEHLEVTTRALVEKHWPMIEQAGTESGDACAALETEMNAAAARMALPPDAVEKFEQLVLTEIKARYQQQIRSMARELVEDFWRSLISVGGLSRPLAEAQGKLAELERVFQRGVDQVAASFSPSDASAFRETVENEDKALSQLWHTDRKAFCKRLGLPDDETAAPRRVAQHHQSLGETVVNTAVRAAVWEGVRALFRAL